MMLKYLENQYSLPTAFFADSDILATGALRALKQVGKKVPHGLSVIGMDDLMLASVSDPPLTTLKIHLKQMGQLAVAILLQKILQPDKSVLKILVGAELVLRDSAKRNF